MPLRHQSFKSLRSFDQNYLDSEGPYDYNCGASLGGRPTEEECYLSGGGLY